MKFLLDTEFIRCVQSYINLTLVMASLAPVKVTISYSYGFSVVVSSTLLLSVINV